MRYACQLVLILFTSASVGCAMCEAPFDNHFAAYGGLRDRVDRVHGRVGSRFDPAASLKADPAVAEPEIDENLPDLPQDDLDDEFNGGADGEADEGGLVDELRKELEKVQEMLPPSTADET